MTFEAPGRPSTPSLFADALSQMTALFETEIRLVRTELSEKISLAIRAVVVLLAAAVLLLVGLLLVLFGVVYVVVALGLPTWGAFLAVGGFFVVVGAIALFIALRSLSADNLMPKRSIGQLGKDATIVKEQVQ